jgi:hypothetical protein
MKLTILAILLLSCLVGLVAGQEDCPAELAAYEACVEDWIVNADAAEQAIVCGECLGELPSTVDTCNELESFVNSCGCGQCADDLTTYVLCGVDCSEPSSGGTSSGGTSSGGTSSGGTSTGGTSSSGTSSSGTSTGGGTAPSGPAANDTSAAWMSSHTVGLAVSAVMAGIALLAYD